MHVMPKGLNHLQMAMNLPFENRKQEDARKIAGYFESLNGTGYFIFEKFSTKMIYSCSA